MDRYETNYGYVGLVDGQYMIFASEGEYNEYCREQNAVEVVETSTSPEAMFSK